METKPFYVIDDLCKPNVLYKHFHGVCQFVDIDETNLQDILDEKYDLLLWQTVIHNNPAGNDLEDHYDIEEVD